MSKSTASNKYRKVDVDQYDPDKFTDETIEGGEGDQVGPNEAEVNKFLSQGDPTKALEVVLSNPPLGGSQSVKDKAIALAVRVLTTFKSSEIDGAVKSLSRESLDVLMKYIYRGFECPEEGSSASLLTWHEKTYAAGGAGCIIRVLTDRKRV